MKDLTVESETDEVSFPWTDKKASDMQSDVAVSGKKITGTLNFIEGGLSPDGPLAGDGYFLALKWKNLDTHTNSLKVGLKPSASGMEPVECFDDPDRNGVFKITDKDNQRLIFIQSDGTHKNVQSFSLKDLILDAEGA